MTRKDFVVIAAMLAESRPRVTSALQNVRPATDEQKAWMKQVDNACARLARTNPRFNEARFRQACWK